jgi:hypothetical protein
MIVCVTRIDRNLTMPHEMASLSDKFRLSRDYKRTTRQQIDTRQWPGELAGQ